MLRIHLFKTLRVIPEGGPPLDLGSPTTRSLMAYLALNRHHPLDRRHLAFVFWPQTSEVAARRNLRQYLHRLRSALAPAEHHAPLLSAAEHTVQLSPRDDVWIDVEEFQDQISRPESQNQGIGLYEGDLLQDLYDDWIAPQREQLKSLYLSTLERLVEAHRTANRLSEAVALAQRMLVVDPLQEKNQALLMTLYYAQGDRARAIQQFKTCVQLLADELGVGPLPETRALYDAMVSGAYRVPPPEAARDAPPVGLPVQERLRSPVPLIRMRTASDHLSPPLVGRESETAKLEAWLAALRTGRGQMVLVQGEPGAGKTRLVQEAIERARPRPALFTGQGREFETMMPYHPLAEALRGGLAHIAPSVNPPPVWMNIIAQLVPEIARQLGLPETPTGTGLADRHQMAEALGSFFVAQAERAPTILFLDDAHWADLATWEFLAYLARRCANTALLVVCVARVEDLPAQAARLARTLIRQGLLATLDVPRLSLQETASLVSHLGLAPDTVLSRRLYEETAGNPFFVIETVGALRDTEGAWTIPTDAEGRRPTFAVPLSVRAVIEARLDRLDDASRSLLSMAAAFGRTFHIELLQNIADTSQAAAITALEEWLARRLVRAAELADSSLSLSSLAYRFEHELIRRIAYSQMSPPRLRWVHRRIAEALEIEPERSAREPAEVAHHFMQSDMPARALPHLIAAGERALSMRSYHEAQQFGLQAVGLLKQMPATADRREGQIDLNLQLALAYSFTGEKQRALPILHETEALAESLGEPARLCRTHYRMAQVMWQQGQPGPAGEYARRALRLAEELDDNRLRAASLRMNGRVSIATSAFDEAISVLQRYLALAPAHRPRPDLAVIYGYLGVAFARLGAWSRALDLAMSGVTCAEGTLSPSTLAVANMQLAFIHAERHDWTACLQVAQRSLPVCEETGFSPHCFMLHALAGRALCQQGEWAEGRLHIEQAMAWARENDYRVFVHQPHLFLSEALLRQDTRGQVQEAKLSAQHALDLAHASGDRWAEAVALRLRAEAQERELAPHWAGVEADLVESRNLLRQIRARPELARTYLSLRRLYDRAAQTAWAVDCHLRATSILEELGMIDELRAAQGTSSSGPSSRTPIPIGAALRGPDA